MPRKKKAAKKEDSHPVNLPKSVLAQADKADELMAGDQPAEPDKTDDDVIVDEPDKDKKLEPTHPTPEKKEPDSLKLTPISTETVKDDSLPEDNQNWKHKYDVLQGMFNAKDTEVKALQQGMANLQTLVNHQAEQLKQIQSAPAAPATAGSAPDASGLKKIDLDSVAGYGDEIVYMAEGFNALIDLNSKLLDQVRGGQTQAPDTGRLDRIESQIRETVQDRYAKSLDAEVPKWREVVNSVEFSGWLQNIDPASGYQYKDLMDYAYNNLRASQAAAIIKRFGIDTGINVGGPAQTSTVQRVGDTNIVDQTRDPLAGQAMPDETTGGDKGQTPVKYPTAEEVAQASALYAQKRISIEEFNDISNRFQQGLKAARKA
jgi:hypothetical protein